VLLCSAFVSAPAPQAPNPVQLENALPGTTAWQTRLGGSADLYATPISAAPGDSVALHVSTPDRYRLNVYLFHELMAVDLTADLVAEELPIDEEARR